MSSVPEDPHAEHSMEIIDLDLSWRLAWISGIASRCTA